MSNDQHSLSDYYDGKDAAYYDGARHDFVSLMPDNPKGRILEIGCGTGGTGALALKTGKCGAYYAVELMPDVAAIAETKLTKVLTGDVEKIELDFPPQSFDACIMSEVIEHLIDPWTVLRKIHSLLSPQSFILASSPNVSHKTTIKQLLRGRFDLTDIGPMDRTHMRWFTPATFSELFSDCGYQIEKAWPIVPLTKRQKLQATLLGGRDHLFIRQMCVMARR